MISHARVPHHSMHEHTRRSGMKQPSLWPLLADQLKPTGCHWSSRTGVHSFGLSLHRIVRTVLARVMISME